MVSATGKPCICPAASVTADHSTAVTITAPHHLSHWRSLLYAVYDMQQVHADGPGCRNSVPPPFRIVMALIGKAFHYMLQARLRERQELLVRRCHQCVSDFANAVPCWPSAEVTMVLR